MHSAQHYRQRAAQVRRLRESVLDPALLKQLETVANEYDQIADHIDKPPATSRPAGFAARAVSQSSIILAISIIPSWSTILSLRPGTSAR